MTRTDPTQIDLEEAIAAAERAQAEFLAPLQRGAPPPGEPIRAKVPAIPDRSMKELREEEREKLAALSREIEEFIERAKDKNSPLHKELSVRVGQRAVSTIFRKARALAEATLPNTHITHPTRERVHKAGGESAEVSVVYEAGAAKAVNHRWAWPVEKAHRLHQLNPAIYMAAAKVRRAFFDLSRPGTMNFSDERRASDPAHRTPTTEEQKAANRLMRYVWARLEDEYKTIVWVLILQQPLPGDEEAMSIVDFGKRIGKSSTEEHARWFALGAMKMVLVRLNTILRHFEVVEKKEKEEALAAQERWNARRTG